MKTIPIVIMIMLFAAVAWGHGIIKENDIDLCWSHCHLEDGSIHEINHCQTTYDPREYERAWERYNETCGDISKKGGLDIMKSPHFSMEEHVKYLAKEGKICEVLGHFWPMMWFFSGEDTKRRKCDVCNKTQQKVTEWQDMEETP